MTTETHSVLGWIEALDLIETEARMLRQALTQFGEPNSNGVSRVREVQARARWIFNRAEELVESVESIR